VDEDELDDALLAEDAAEEATEEADVVEDALLAEDTDVAEVALLADETVDVARRTILPI